VESLVMEVLNSSISLHRFVVPMTGRRYCAQDTVSRQLNPRKWNLTLTLTKLSRKFL
jgi:hypothetical protein